MVTGTVVGSVWATRRLDALRGGALLEVVLEATGTTIVALDLLGTGVGERVLVVQGSVASTYLDDHPPVDALIIGSIDEEASGRP